MHILKKISLANRVLDIVSKVRRIAANNKDHTAALKKGIDLIKQGANVIVAELPWLKPLYNEIAEACKNA